MNLTNEQVQLMVNTMTVAERKDWVQTDAYGCWCMSLSRGTIEAATGVGKTKIGVTAAAKELASNPDAIVYIMVPTQTLQKEDWPDEFRKWGCEHLLKKVKIVCHASMPKTIAKADVDLLVWDECHHATDKAAAFFSNNKVFKVLGLSATLPSDRNEEDEIKRDLIDKFCPSIYKVSLEEAIALELVADFEVKVLKLKLDDVILRNYGTEQKPEKFTELGRYQSLTKKLQKAMYNKKFQWQKFSIIQKRMELIMNLPSKTALAKQCMDSILKEEKRTLIFCGSIDQSITLCGTNIYNSQSGTEALEQFQRKEIHYLGVVNALDEGKNINELDQSMIVQLNSNSRKLIQRIGRNLRIRPGHKALIVVLVARDTADEKWYLEAFSSLDKSRIKEYHVKIS